MHHVDLTYWFHLIEHVIVGASIISMLMPPVEWFDGYPGFQKFYGLMVKIIHYYAALGSRTAAMKLVYGVDVSKAAAVIDQGGKVSEATKAIEPPTVPPDKP